MERTINSKSLKQVIDELVAAFSQDEICVNKAGYEYIEIEVYRARLDSIVGPLGYDFTLSNISWVAVGDKCHISCIGTISIRDDSGNIVVSKSASGDADVIVRNTDGVVVKSGNDAKTAASDAFKGCCRMLGIGDAQLREKRKNKKSGSSKSQKQSGDKSNTSSKEEELRIVVRGAFKSLGGKGYKAPAVIKQTGEQVYLVLWKEGIEEIKKHMPLADFLEKYKNKEFSIVAIRDTFRGNNGKTEEQVIMIRPGSVREAS